MSININKDLISNVDEKILKSLFEGQITEESTITDNEEDLKTKACETNELAIFFLQILLSQKERINIIFNRQKYKIIKNNINKITEHIKKYIKISKIMENIKIYMKY